MTFSFNGMLNPGQYRLLAYTDVNGSSESNLDFVFTISSGVATPEPGTGLLLEIGLLGFAFRRERKSHDSGNPSRRRSALLKPAAKAA